MDPHIFMNFFTGLVLVMCALAVVFVWFITVMFFRDGEYGFGSVIGIISLLLTGVVLVVYNVVFGWSFPVNFSGMGYTW